MHARKHAGNYRRTIGSFLRVVVAHVISTMINDTALSKILAFALR